MTTSAQQQPNLSEDLFAHVAKNLADIGGISFEDYLDEQYSVVYPVSRPLPSALACEPLDANAITRLHQACQRAFHSTTPLKFEFIEQSGSRQKQCILTITKPDGVTRSYATQPTFTKKNDAKSEAAKIAIERGALDFLGTGHDQTISGHDPALGSVTISDTLSTQPKAKSEETYINDIEQCCLDWRAGRVIPHWVPFFNPKSAHKQGCALTIQLSEHIMRVYLSDPMYDTRLDAKAACAKVAVRECVLDFIKYGNGQTRPSSPDPSTLSTTPFPPLGTTTPWTLQGFYDTLPRPFPEPFGTDDVAKINAPGWLNTAVQNARGGKLVLSFFFTSDGPPGLHGCVLKVDRPGEYKAFLVNARFPKRSDAKAAVCLQAISDGAGNYIRSIASAIETKITPVMRSFSSGLVYPALTSELAKIDNDLHPYFEYEKERDAFGASLVVRLSASPSPEQIRRYTAPIEYRNKADAKVAVLCNAAEQGVVEFVRFRAATPPSGYLSPYVLETYDPESSRKRKQHGSAEDVERHRPLKKKKSKRRAETSHSQGSLSAPPGQGPYLPIQPSSDHVHSASWPGDMSLPQSVPANSSCDPSQSGVGGGGGSGAVQPLAYGHGALYHASKYTPSYTAMVDPGISGAGGVDTSNHEYGGRPPCFGAHGVGSHASRSVDVHLSPESGPSRAMPGASSRSPRVVIDHAELEPGEVVSSAESDFSESSSRNEDDVPPAKEQDVDVAGRQTETESIDTECDVEMDKDKWKGKAKEMSPAAFMQVTPEGPGMTSMMSASHVQKLIDYCATHHCGTPSFYETERQGRFHVWIVIGQERFDLPTTYGSAEEGRHRVAKQVLARLNRAPAR